MKRLLILILIVCLWAAAGCENQALLRKYDGPYVEKPYLYGDRWLAVDGVRLCYTTRGEGPPLIFLRGAGGSIDYWHETLPHFERDFTVYAFDLAGFGKSDKPNVDYTIDFHTRMILGAMDRLGIRRASFVGNSLGGHLAMNIAIRYPDRVDKLVLQAATGCWSYPNPAMRLTLAMVFTDGFFQYWRVQDWYALWGQLTMYRTANSEEKLTEWIRRRHADDFPELCRAYSRSIKGIYYGTLRGQLQHIKAPTLILWGDDDARHPVSDARYLHKHIADSRLILFKDGRQMLPWDFKEDFNREVMTFLKHPAVSNFDVKTIETSPLADSCDEY